MSKIAIIGAGISGLSAGQILGKNHNVELFDKASKPGGLVKCDRINDNLFHKVGGHVFNSRNQKVLDWFWSFFDRDNEFIKARRNAKILLQGKLIGYPLENYLHQLDKSLVSKILDDFISPDYKPKDPFSYDNFAEFLRSNFGETLYETYFRPYNEKIWNTDLSNIPLAWLDGKLPMPNLKEMLLSNIVVQEETEMVHATFYYAKEDGSQFIANRLAKGLHIHQNAEISHIEKREGKYWLSGQGPFDKIVYTGDIRKIDQILSGTDISRKISGTLKDLPSNGTSNIFCETDFGDISWLYLPGEEVKAHRIIYTGTFAESNNRGSKRQTCVVEFSGNYTYDFMCDQIKKLPGNLIPLGYNQEPNSYILHTHASKAAIEEVRATLKKENIFLLGRFAEWEYYNMDKAIEAAMALDEEISKL
jgi:protoporphyrinogen oxidase